MDKELIQEIKHRNPIRQVARELNIKFKGKNDANCFKHSDKVASLSFYSDNGIEKFNCHACDDIGGDVIALVRQVKDCGFVEAAKYLAERARISLEQPEQKQKRNDYTGKALKAVIKLKNNEKAQTYLKSRGFKENIIDKLKIGFDDGSIFGPRFKNMIIYPYYKDKEVAYIKGRSIEGERKLENIGGTVPCLYNHNALHDGSEQIVLCEGESDTIILLQEGFVTAGLSGIKGFKDDWASDFKGKAVFIVMDNDSKEETREAVEKAKQKLKDKLESSGAEIHLIALPGQVNDVNDLFLENPDEFEKTFSSLIVDALERERLCVPATDFLKEEPKETKPLITGEVLPREGTMFMGGPAKGFKTMFTLQMGLCLAQGEPFLDHEIKMPISVLYIGKEISAPNLWKRLSKMVESIDKNCLSRFYIYTGDSLKLDTEKGLNTLRRAIKQTGVRTVLIDPLYKFWNLNENSAEDVGKFLDNLDKVKSEYGVAIAIVHHHRKPSFFGNDSSPNQLRGSSTLFAYGDSYLTLNQCKKQGKGYRLLSYELRNAEAPPDKILKFNTDTLFFEVESIKQEAKVISAEQVLSYLVEHGDTEQQKISEHFEEQASKSSIRNCLRAIEGKYIEKYHSGRKNFIRLIDKENEDKLF